MRSNDRAVLSIHPIDPQAYFKALILDTVLRSLWLPLRINGIHTLARGI